MLAELWIDIIKNSMVSVIVWSFCLSLWGVRSQSVKPLYNRLIWDGIHSSVLSFTNCGIKNNLILQSIPRLVLSSCSSPFFPTSSFWKKRKEKEETVTTFDQNLLQCVRGHVHAHRRSRSWNREPKIFHHLRRERKPRHLGIVPWELLKCCWGATADAIRSDSFSVPLPSFSSLPSSICHSIIPSSVLSLFCHYLCPTGWLLAIVARHQIGRNACDVSRRAFFLIQTMPFGLL